MWKDLCTGICWFLDKDQILGQSVWPLPTFLTSICSTCPQTFLVQSLQAISFLWLPILHYISAIKKKSNSLLFWLMPPNRTFWNQLGVFLHTYNPSPQKTTHVLRGESLSLEVKISQTTTTNCNFQDPDGMPLLQEQASVTPRIVLLHCLPYFLTSHWITLWVCLLTRACVWCSVLPSDEPTVTQ